MPVPVPFQVRVGPEGVIVPPEGAAAKLSQLKDAPKAQRRRAMTTRRLKRPDCEAELFCIGVGLSSRSAKRHRRTFLVSNFSSPMEAFYAIENRLSSIFL